MKKTSTKKSTKTTTTSAVKSKAASTVKKAVAALSKTQTPASPAISLKIKAPAAKEVFVAGSFNDWQPSATPLKKAAGGKWTAELTLQPGQYEYLFVVDNQWTVDPEAQEAVPNPFGGCNCLLKVA